MIDRKNESGTKLSVCFYEMIEQTKQISIENVHRHANTFLYLGSEEINTVYLFERSK